MEHRCSERVNTDLKILIYKMDIPIAIGRIKNGSKLGFFVETDFADINLLQLLDVEVLLSRGPELTRYRYTTRVIRKTELGLGLELEAMSVESADALNELLRSPPARQPVHNLPVKETTYAVDNLQYAAKMPKKMVQAS